MSELVFDNVGVYMGGYNLSSNINQVSLNAKQDTLDITTFGSSSRERIAGLKDVDVSGSGYFAQGNLIADGDMESVSGWSSSADCSIASTAGGQAGNCMTMTATGAAGKDATKTVSLKAGRSYKVSCYIKDGTQTGQDVNLQVYNAIYLSSSLIKVATTSSWVQITYLFTVTTSADYDVYITWDEPTASGTILIDTVELYELQDTALHGNLSVENQPITITPDGTTAGDTAYFYPSVQGEYGVGGSIGEVLPFSWAAHGSQYALCRGNILYSSTATSTSTSTGQNLGAVTSSQKLYAVLHVVGVSGASPTLDVTVQSDDSSEASYLTKVTFTQATGITSQFAVPISGAIADDYWRISYTIGGTNPSFTFVVAMAIF